MRDMPSTEQEIARYLLQCGLAIRYVKVRHVASAAGVEAFHKPIGTPLGGGGSPVSPLSSSAAKPDFASWNTSKEPGASVQWTRDAAKEIAGRVASLPESQIPGGDPEGAVYTTLRNWGITANSTGTGLAFQNAVRDEFGLGPVFDLPDAQWGSLALERDQETAQHGDFYRQVARGMYERTQRILAAQGITEVQAYRGSGSHHSTDGGVALARPSSAYTADRALAERYTAEASDPTHPGILVSRTIPAAQVLGTARTGLGTARENEIVVLARTPTK